MLMHKLLKRINLLVKIIRLVTLVQKPLFLQQSFYLGTCGDGQKPDLLVDIPITIRIAQKDRLTGCFRGKRALYPSYVEKSAELEPGV